MYDSLYSFPNCQKMNKLQPLIFIGQKPIKILSYVFIISAMLNKEWDQDFYKSLKKK